MSISNDAMQRLVLAVNGLTESMTELAKATDRSTDQIDRTTTIVDEAAERLEGQDEEEMPGFPPGSIGEDMVFIDQSGLSSGLPRNGVEEEDDEDDEWSSPMTHDELIERMDGDFSSTTANSLMEQVMRDTMDFSPGVLHDFGLSEPNQQDKFGAIQFVVKYCDVSVEELFRTVPLLPNTSHEAIHTLCVSPTHSPYYGSVLWGYGGPKTPK
jgi:hypothetical protein